MAPARIGKALFAASLLIALIAGVALVGIGHAVAGTATEYGLWTAAAD
ncbi:MAG TPA: hypothetical protein VEB20_01245 [Azospirillaceae bacterium]|nr:hypothetical protein [Azospirillaceae bacterium]